MSIFEKLSSGFRFYYGWIIVAVALIFFPFVGLFGIYIILVHNVKFLVDQGVAKMTAAFILVIVAFLLSGAFIWLAAPRKYRGVKTN